MTTTDDAGTTARLVGFTPPAEGRLVRVVLAGRAVALTTCAGRLHAFDDTCPHMQCSLALGDVEDGAVVCPCHFATFDLVTGAVRSGPTRTALRTHAASLDGDVLSVELRP